jgi:hypothetical protein
LLQACLFVKSQNPVRRSELFVRTRQNVVQSAPSQLQLSVKED